MKKSIKPTFPCEVDVTLQKAFEINMWCAQIMNSSILGGKLSFDLARLADNSEQIIRPFQKLRKKTEEEINANLEKEGKLPVSGKALDKRVNELLQDVLDDETQKFKLRIPELKKSYFIADKDYKHVDISEGDLLVPMGFIKAMIDWIEEDV